MKSWPSHPPIYEINTWVWLDELSRKAAHPITLGSVPDEKWDQSRSRDGSDASGSQAHS